MNADREEKSTYANSTCSGKLCDYLFLVTIVQSYVHESVKLQILDLILTTIYLQSNGNQEIGIGENSGPKRKYHHDKSITNFVDVIRVARSQHIKSQHYALK